MADLFQEPPPSVKSTRKIITFQKQSGCDAVQRAITEHQLDVVLRIFYGVPKAV